MVTRALGVLLAVGACSSADLAAPVIRARLGPAANRPIRRAVALPATCGSLTNPSSEAEPASDATGCPPAALEGVDQALRSALDFSGLEVIDAERVNAVTATHREIEHRRDGSSSRTIEIHGARFADATPFEQAAILQELHADAVVNTRIWVGAGTGVSGRRTVAVQVRMIASSDRALVWARRCELEVGLLPDATAIGRVAACLAEASRSR